MNSGPGNHERPANRLCRTDADILGALLREAGRTAEAREMQERVLCCGGSVDALLVVDEYLRTERRECA